MAMIAIASRSPKRPLVLYALRRADDALILGHRLSEWCGHAPMLEEDMALANMGLDLLGQARELYGYAAKVEGKGNDEDKFAYLRDVRQYRNLLLVEQPNGDFARTMVRQFFYAAFADLYWRAMMQSSDATLAAIAAKSEKESAYHLRHSSEWMIRLGDGTEESHARAQAAIDDLWAYTGEMFAVDDGERGLIDAGIAIDPATLQPQWLKTVSSVVERGDAGPAEERLDAAGRPHRPAQRASRPSPQRTAVDAANLSGGDMVTACSRRCRSAPARLGRRGAGGRSRNPGADHRRSRRAARRRGQRRPRRGRDHADLFRLPGDEHDRAGNRAGAGARGHSPAQGPHRAVAGLDHRLDERGRPPQAAGNTASRRRRPAVPAARCSASRRWRARNAAPAIPSCCPNSARPPARRCGAARAAASRSTISSVIDRCRTRRASIASPSTICAAKPRMRCR